MSIHPSLSSSGKGKSHRTVLKRSERIKHLQGKGKWTEESKVYGLPKIKMIRLKVAKKEKAAEKPEGEAAAEATGATTETKASPTGKEKSKS